MTEQEIIRDVTKAFRTFGKGNSSSPWGNPLAAALKDKEPMFAAGVDVAEVVKFVIERSNK